MRFLSRLSPRVRQVVDWIVGLTLIGVGIVGFVLPVLQGWLFVIMGLAVLSSHNRHAKAVYERLKSMGRSVRDRVAQTREARRERRGARVKTTPVAMPKDEPEGP